MINYEMNKQSRLKKIKIKNKEENKYSIETKNLIKEKNILYKENERNNSEENKRKLKNIKIEISSKKNKEDFIYKKKKFQDNVNNPKKSWSEAKNLLYGNRNSFPDRIIDNNSIKTGSKAVANVLNRFYINKVN